MMSGPLHRCWLSLLACAWLAPLLTGGAAVALADESPSFQGKTVSMIIGYGAGGSLDNYGRLIAPYLSQHLSGNPTIVVRNMTGADGVVGLNFFYTQAKPDGLTVTVGGATQVDPLHFLSAKAVYDVAKLSLVGGNTRAGTAVVIRKDAETRLHNSGAPPAVMGALAAVRTGMQSTLWGAEYLGWNAKWVLGYPTAKALVLGLERGEIDMTSIGDVRDVQRLTASGNFDVLSQSGYVRDGALMVRAEFGGPLLSDLIGDKIADPVAQRAFVYWKSIIQVGEFIALPLDTPQPILDAYRAAYRATVADPDFKAKLVASGDEFLPQSADELTALFATLAGTPPAALAYLRDIAKRQGMSLGE